MKAMYDANNTNKCNKSSYSNDSSKIYYFHDKFAAMIDVENIEILVIVIQNVIFQLMMIVIR